MLISCGHTICEKCLKNYANEEKPMKCVYCNENETIYLPTKNYADKFPLN